MQVVPEDVLQGFRSLWEGSSAAGIISGGLHHARADNNAELPYAVIVVTEGEREEWSGLTYLAKFIVTIRVWDMAKAGATGQYSSQLATIFDRTTRLVVPNAASVIHCRHMPGTLDVTPEPRNAEDVLKVERRWEVMVAAERENQ